MKEKIKSQKVIVILLITVIISFIGVYFMKEVFNKPKDNQNKNEIEKEIINENNNETNADINSGSKKGAAAAKEDKDLTLEDMLRYSLEDEYLARNEYLAIMTKYGEITPFANIKKAEDTHINMLIPLFKKYNLELVELDDVKPYDVTLKEAYETGVTAEIENIAMYDRFLKEELNDDIRDAFVKLKAASEKHLEAFKRRLEKNK